MESIGRILSIPYVRVNGFPGKLWKPVRVPAGGLSERIRFLRERRGLSRKELGEAVGYRGDSAYQTAYEWETGRRGLDAAQVPMVARALSVTISELYGVEPPSEEELQATGLLALKVDDYRALTDEDWRMVREFIEYRIAVRKSEQRNREEAADGAA